MPEPTLANALRRAKLRLELHRSPWLGVNVFNHAQARSYDWGSFGDLPSQVFNSTNVIAPKILRRTWTLPACEADPSQYYFLSPYGLADFFSGPMIIDYRGRLIWHGQNHPESYGLDVQQYFGQPYLTWWTGDNLVRGHGIGAYYMVILRHISQSSHQWLMNIQYDNTYQLRLKQGAFNNMPADLHEFHITVNNTAISTSFAAARCNLASVGGPVDGFVWDGIFQEYNMETRKLLFQWRSLDHISPESGLCDSVFFQDHGTRDRPWDYYHINSIDKDHLGNYLVSARRCGIVYISSRTGKILWKLGGQGNAFKDLSGGRATNFLYQHHARWTDNFTAITLFDNHAVSNYTLGIPSRGLKLEVNQKAMTVRVLNELTHPSGRIGNSQGSMQTLTNGNFLVGYGHTGAMTEFTPDGGVVCDIQFSPLHAGVTHEFEGGNAQSYRVFRRPWVAQPWWDPEVAITNDHVLYVSWNGATEVRYWRLEGSPDRSKWHLIGEVTKDDFETAILINPRPFWMLYRLTALNSRRELIKQWNVFQSGAVQPLDSSTADAVQQTPQASPAPPIVLPSPTSTSNLRVSSVAQPSITPLATDAIIVVKSASNLSPFILGVTIGASTAILIGFLVYWFRRYRRYGKFHQVGQENDVWTIEEATLFRERSSDASNSDEPMLVPKETPDVGKAINHGDEYSSLL